MCTVYSVQCTVYSGGSNWGEPERAPHLPYCCAKSSLYLRAVRPFDRPWSNLVPQRAPLNAQRANVGPASNDSKVNNIALKTVTLVLRFSLRSSHSTEKRSCYV